MDFDIRELSLENIGAWPEPVKYTVITLCCVFLLVLGYWIDIKGMLESMSTLKTGEKDLRLQIEVKNAEVANLPAYQDQLEQMQKNFTVMLRKLPGRTEIPGLLEDISKIGRANGLAFKWFKPGTEKLLEFYAELPIRIGVVGNYHQLATFVSEVSAMDRIVTLDDFTIKPAAPELVAKSAKTVEADSVEKGLLLMEITAKTYRYNDEPKPKGSEAK